MVAFTGGGGEGLKGCPIGTPAGLGIGYGQSVRVLRRQGLGGGHLGKVLKGHGKGRFSSPRP